MTATFTSQIFHTDFFLNFCFRIISWKLNRKFPLIRRTPISMSPNCPACLRTIRLAPRILHQLISTTSILTIWLADSKNWKRRNKNLNFLRKKKLIENYLLYHLHFLYNPLKVFNVIMVFWIHATLFLKSWVIKFVYELNILKKFPKLLEK